METLLYLLPGFGCVVTVLLSVGLMPSGMRSQGHGTDGHREEAPELGGLTDEAGRLHREQPRKEAPSA
jgi:hypothetical protein